MWGGGTDSKGNLSVHPILQRKARVRERYESDALGGSEIRIQLLQLEWPWLVKQSCFKV